MDENYNSSINNFQINMIEYCTLKKDLIFPGAKNAYVKVHKLMPYCNKNTETTNNSMFVNDKECEVELEGSIKISDAVKVSLFDAPFDDLGKAIYSKVKDQEGTTVSIQTGTKIPKGTKMLVLFMDGNINDGYLTNWIAR